MAAKGQFQATAGGAAGFAAGSKFRRRPGPISAPRCFAKTTRVGVGGGLPRGIASGVNSPSCQAARDGAHQSAGDGRKGRQDEVRALCDRTVYADSLTKDAADEVAANGGDWQLTWDRL